MGGYKYKNPDDLCDICGNKGTEDNIMSYHHIMPQQIKECNKKDNVVPLCRKCHDLVEAIYLQGMLKLNPLWAKKEELEKDRNKAISFHTSYKELVEKKDDEALEEYLKRFLSRGFKLHQFNHQGHDKIWEEAAEKVESHRKELNSIMEKFNWREYYNGCKVMIKVTDQFRNA